MTPWAVVAAVVVFATIALLTKPWTSRTAQPSESVASATSPAAAPAAQQEPPVPAAASAPTPTASSGTHAMQAELIADRHVWVRVFADGEKTLERELAAGTRVPIVADRAIVIRAGDAGAVRLRMNGEDRGALGKDAEVVTRAFTPQR
jgi:cytoskeletal protein RodZ